MEAHLQAIFDSVPEDAPRSRLEPYRELILRWRRQGRSYRRIRELLAEKCSLKVADMTLYEFVQRRSRPRKPKPELESEAGEMPSIQPAPASAGSLPARPRLSSEERRAQREYIRSLAKPPAVVSATPAKPRFEYDPDQPLIIDRTIKD